MKMDVAELGHAVSRDVRLASAVDRRCLAGFGSRSAAAARTELPDAACSASLTEVRADLYRSWIRWAPRGVAYGGYQVPETAGRIRVVSPRFLGCAHWAGLRDHVWVVDEE